MSVRSSIFAATVLSLFLGAFPMSSAQAGRGPSIAPPAAAERAVVSTKLRYSFKSGLSHFRSFQRLRPSNSTEGLSFGLPAISEDPASLSFHENDFILQSMPVSIRPKARPDNLFDQFVRSLPRTMIGQSPLTCLQIAIYHEARSETSDGQRAVASVILQRAKLPEYFGQGVCGVISKPSAFSYVREDLSTPPITEIDAWLKSGRIARQMLDVGPLPDLDGADHYHTKAVAPGWRRKMVRVKTIGAHIFYSDPALDYAS